MLNYQITEFNLISKAVLCKFKFTSYWWTCGSTMFYFLMSDNGLWCILS